jgi:hypothetical protein
MLRTLFAAALAASLLAPPALAKGRARDNAVVSASVMSAREPLDACGGRDLLDAVVPDGPFLEACKFHDACYRSGQLDQGVCDADFLSDMREACDANCRRPAPPASMQPAKWRPIPITARSIPGSARCCIRAA